MNIGIRSRAVFDLALTKPHVDGLIVLSQHHYDTRCKMASREGGFIYGWNNQVTFWEQYPDPDRDFCTVSATDDDMQITLKILETIWLCENARLIEPVTAMLLRALSRDLSGALSLSSEKYSEWQTTFVSGN